MTLHQMQVAVEAQRCGSISGAAEKLSISQPNASNNIRFLESELGFSIFDRHGNGVEPTEKGYEFLEHAGKIVSESNQIALLNEKNHIFRLHLGVMNYSPAIDSYLKLCAHAQSYRNADLSYETTSPNDGIKLLHDHKMDIAAIIYMNEYIPTIEKMCYDNHLEIVSIAKVSYNVNFRKGHPLDCPGEFLKDEKDLALLKDYPFADYSRMNTIIGPMNGEPAAKIPYKFRILVDERDARCRLLSMTDAFSVGCQLSRSVLDRYGLVCYPLAQNAAEFSCIIRAGEKKRAEIHKYLEILEDEVHDTIY